MAQLAAGRDRALNELMTRHGERLYHYLLRVLQNDTEPLTRAHAAISLGRPVATGRFAAMMSVSLVNDGPVTFRLRVAPR